MYTDIKLQKAELVLAKGPNRSYIWFKLDQKSAFDEDMPNKVGDVARLSNDRKEIDDAKE